MIYLSIVLILCGALLVMLSFLVSPRETGEPADDRYEAELPDIREEDLDLDLDFPEMEKTRPEARETRHPEAGNQNVFTGRKREIPPERLYPLDDDAIELPPDDDMLSMEEGDDLSLPDGDIPVVDNIADAVMFEDSSGVIDYESGYGTIDPSRDKYRNIKRRGRGEISLEKDGITFHLGKKLFRYDFYRMSDIHRGENYIALVPSAESPVKLFIFPGPDSLIDRIADAFESYRKSSAR